MQNIRSMLWGVISFLKRANSNKPPELKLLTLIDKSYQPPSRSLVVFNPTSHNPGIKEQIMGKIDYILNLLNRAWEKPKSVASTWKDLIAQELRKLKANTVNIFSKKRFNPKLSAIALGALIIPITGYTIYSKTHQSSHRLENLVFINVPSSNLPQRAGNKTEINTSNQIVLNSAGDVIRNNTNSNPINKITVDHTGMITPKL